MRTDEHNRKWRYLNGYRQLKTRLVCLCERRDEYRDLKRIAEDLGLPPPTGQVGDPTGNTATRLLDEINKLSVEIDTTIAMLSDINTYIDCCRSEHDRLILVLKFVKGMKNEEIMKQYPNWGIQSIQSFKRRLRRIVNDLPDLK